MKFAFHSLVLLIAVLAIMILTPDDILTFGKNKGHALKLIYKFNPSYIEWLIKNIDGFTIDIKKFTSLPDPTPVDTYRQGIIVDKPEDSASIGSQIKNLFISMPGGQQAEGLRNNWNYTVKEAIDLESKGVVIPSIKYTFPHDIIVINENKQSNLNQSI